MNRLNNADAWLATLEASLTTTTSSPYGDVMPGFPTDEWQLHTVGLSGANALREAAQFMEVCVERFKKSSLWSQPDKRLLDFGTGWGRIARCFMRDFKGKNIVGSDINPMFLEMARWNFNTGRFIQTEPLPPLRYEAWGNELFRFPDAGTDFIVAYSVFSHLSEHACLEWVKEFSRILAPGGMLAVTTRGRWFFDTAEKLRDQPVTGYPKGLSEMFDNFDDARARYDHGEFVHANTPLIGDGKHYGESFIPESYVRKTYGTLFDVVDFHLRPGEQHPVIVLQKKAH